MFHKTSVDILINIILILHINWGRITLKNSAFVSMNIFLHLLRSSECLLIMLYIFCTDLVHLLLSLI